MTSSAGGRAWEEPSQVAGLTVRRLTDEDAPAVIDLIGSVYAEYAGCVLDLPGVDADLPTLASSWAAVGGFGWVVLDATDVVACVGLAPAVLDGRVGAELKRLYVAWSHRRRGLGAALVSLVESTAREAFDAEAIELWSDTRFTDAHRLYERCGFQRQSETRELHDPSNTTEFRFVKVLVE